MSLRRVVLPEAEEDIRQAMLWYEAQRDGLGFEFLDVLEDAMGRAAAAAFAYEAWTEDARYRRVVLRRFPYLLLYEVRGDVIEFVAVAHARRDPGFWVARLPLR